MPPMMEDLLIFLFSHINIFTEKLKSTSQLSLIETLSWGGLAGLLVNLITPTVANWMLEVKSKFSRISKTYSVQGVFDCQYYIPWKSGDDAVIYERIVLRKIARDKDRFIGYLINNPDDEKFRKVEKPEIRVVCELLGGSYPIGWWQHPDPNDRHHGCFMLHLDDSGKDHSGLWSGKSSTYNRILSGRWLWTRNSNIVMSHWQFRWLLFRGY